MKVEQSYLGPTLYTGNAVTEELVICVREALESIKAVHVSFDVIGRTKHEMLSYELEGKLGEDYEVKVTYRSYGCKITKRRVR